MTTPTLESYYDVGRSSQVGISNSDQYCCGSSWPVLPHIFAYCVHVVYTSIIFCYIIPNFFTLQQLPPWLSGKASHLYQLDMRRSLVRFGQVANFFFAFFEVWTIFEYLPFLSCSLCFCFQLSPSTIVQRLLSVFVVHVRNAQILWERTSHSCPSSGNIFRWYTHLYFLMLCH